MKGYRWGNRTIFLAGKTWASLAILASPLRRSGSIRPRCQSRNRCRRSRAFGSLTTDHLRRLKAQTVKPPTAPIEFPTRKPAMHRTGRRAVARVVLFRQAELFGGDCHPAAIIDNDRAVIATSLLEFRKMLVDIFDKFVQIFTFSLADYLFDNVGAKRAIALEL